MKSPQEIVELMLNKDSFSHWMNVKILEIDKGKCTLKSIVHSEMLNGFEIAHGGISYSLSDSALAFAANAYGMQCVSIETSISHLRQCKLGDELIVHCNEIHRGKSIGIYSVRIKNQREELVSIFKGTVHISNRPW